MLCMGAILAGCNKDPFETDDRGTFIDARDGREYEWVKIGDQLWMAENLAWLPSVSASSSGSMASPVYYVIGYGGSNEADAKSLGTYIAYGALYNHKAAMTACPEGWKLPGDDDWQAFEQHLGMSEDEAGSEGFRLSGDVGTKLKAEIGWANGGFGDNSSGFKALPGGFRLSSTGTFAKLGQTGCFWTSYDFGGGMGYHRCLYESGNGVDRGEEDFKTGLSVRCLRK